MTTIKIKNTVIPVRNIQYVHKASWDGEPMIEIYTQSPTKLFFTYETKELRDSAFEEICKILSRTE